MKVVEDSWPLGRAQLRPFRGTNCSMGISALLFPLMLRSPDVSLRGGKQPWRWSALPLLNTNQQDSDQEKCHNECCLKSFGHEPILPVHRPDLSRLNWTFTIVTAIVPNDYEAAGYYRLHSLQSWSYSHQWASPLEQICQSLGETSWRHPIQLICTIQGPYTLGVEENMTLRARWAMKLHAQQSTAPEEQSTDPLFCSLLISSASAHNDQHHLRDCFRFEAGSEDG